MRHLDVQVSPLLDAHDVSGVVVSFADVTALRVLNEEVESARLKLQIAYEELQSTVEELETTNEELQSTNEELETTNEELQSTNEELETLNEELQSTNEELATINDEMAERTHEALRANSLLSSILSSIQQSVVVVDRGLRVLAWSRTATEVWGAREDEVLGEHFLNLDIGVPTGDLRDAIRVVLAGETTDDVVLAGHDRRGHSILTTVSLGPLLGPGEEVQGAILLMTSEREREV